MKKHNSKTYIYKIYECKFECLHDSIVVSIPACHAGDRGSIPRRGASFILEFYALPCHERCVPDDYSSGDFHFRWLPK